MCGCREPGPRPDAGAGRRLEAVMHRSEAMAVRMTTWFRIDAAAPAGFGGARLVQRRAPAKVRSLPAPAAALLAALLLLSGAPAAQEGPEAEARKALDAYIAAFNDEDNEAIAAASNFPRLTIGLDGQIVVRENPEEILIDFRVLRAAEMWDHTTLDLVDAAHVSPDKVHFRVVTSRRLADGRPYRTTPALYIITNHEGEWGLQVQSMLPPTFSARRR